MARNGDVGPYAHWNVTVAPVEINTSDGQSRGSDVGRSTKQTGCGRGWTIKRGRFQVTVGKKYVGTFASQAQAEDAYRAACVRHVEAAESR